MEISQNCSFTEGDEGRKRPLGWSPARAASWGRTASALRTQGRFIVEGRRQLDWKTNEQKTPDTKTIENFGFIHYAALMPLHRSCSYFNFWINTKPPIELFSFAASIQHSCRNQFHPSCFKNKTKYSKRPYNGLLQWSFCSSYIAQPYRMWEWGDNGRPEREIEIHKTGFHFMLGNFNGNFDQWLIGVADKTPCEKKKSSITWVQELNTDHRHHSAPRCQQQLEV